MHHPTSRYAVESERQIPHTSYMDSVFIFYRIWAIVLPCKPSHGSACLFQVFFFGIPCDEVKPFVRFGSKVPYVLKKPGYFLVHIHIGYERRASPSLIFVTKVVDEIQVCGSEAWPWDLRSSSHKLR